MQAIILVEYGIIVVQSAWGWEVRGGGGRSEGPRTRSFMFVHRLWLEADELCGRVKGHDRDVG